MIQESKTKDMTVGSPTRLILGFALPLMLGNVFQQLYTFVDTMVVGQALGVRALAALGATEWLVFLLFGFIQGITQGFSVAVSQQFGATDYRRLRKTIGNALYLSVLGTILFTIIGQFMLHPILQLLHTPKEIIGLAECYLRILYAGVGIAMAYNLCAAILRALGNSKAPLKAMTIASICNIVLDVLFVFGFGWGIEGAAIATLLSQLFAAGYCFVKLRGIEILRFEKEDFAIDTEILEEELKLGLPMGLQNTITAMGGLIVQSVINGFGVLFIAGFTAANKLYGLLEIAASSYGYAVSSYTGQNIGANRVDRVRKGLRAANIVGSITAIGMSAIMLLFGKIILACFITGDAETIQNTVQIGFQFLVILAGAFPLLYILYITRACIQGLGNSILPMLSSIAQLVMRTGCALLLPGIIGEAGVFYGEVAAWVGADLILIISYYYVLSQYSSKKYR